MKKTIMGLSAAALIAAGSVAVPQRAEAYPAWVIPAVIGAAFGGVIIGGVATQSAYAYGPGPTYAEPAPRGSIAVRTTGPGPGCTIVRQRMADGGVRRVRVCPVD